MHSSHPRIALVAASLDILGGQGVQAQTPRRGARGRRLPRDVSADQSAHSRAGCGWVRRVPGLRTMVNQSDLPAQPAADLARPMSCTCSRHPIGRFCWRRCRRCWRRGRSTSAWCCTTTAAKPTITSRDWGALVHPWLRLADEIVVPSEYLQRVFAPSRLRRARHSKRRRPRRAFAYRERQPLRPRAAVDAQSRAVLPRRSRDRGVRAVQGGGAGGDADHCRLRQRGSRAAAACGVRRR